MPRRVQPVRPARSLKSKLTAAWFIFWGAAYLIVDALLFHAVAPSNSDFVYQLGYCLIPLVIADGLMIIPAIVTYIFVIDR